MQLIHDNRDYSIGYDPHEDTPIELLHTILLGIVKYVWHDTHTAWKDAEKALFSVRLQSTDVRALSIPPIRATYIMNYANSLVGRQLKALLQSATFHVHDLVSPLRFSLWKAIGELSALFWYPEITDLKQYLVQSYRRTLILIIDPLFTGRP